MQLRSFLIAVFLILVCVVIISNRADAESIFATQYGEPDGYCGGIKFGGSTYNCALDYGAASAVFPLGAHLLVCFDGCAEVVIDNTCGGCYLDLDLGPASDIGLPGASTIEVTLL